MLAVDVTVDHAALQRSWPVKREDGDQVPNMVGLHALEQFAHAVRFKLENAFGIAALKQLKRLGVVERQFSRIDIDAARFLDELHGVIEHRQIAKSEEVHLQQTDGLQIAHDPLRCNGDLAGLAAGLLTFADDSLERHKVAEIAIGNDDTGGMRAGVAIGAFEPSRRHRPIRGPANPIRIPV